VIRLLIRLVVFLASAAIGILVAAGLLDGMTLHASGFVVVVVVYAVVQSIISPFLVKVAAKNATAFLGGIGLVSAFVALFVASLIGDGLSISGAGTWIAAAVIVWLVTAIATLMLPWMLVKAGVESARKDE
jgi:uncharacterized membrane protein YvlD (DUF360 family)